MQALAHVFTGYMRDDFEEDPDPGDKEPEPFRGLRTIHSVLDEIQGLPQSHLRGGTA